MNAAQSWIESCLQREHDARCFYRYSEELQRLKDVSDLSTVLDDTTDWVTREAIKDLSIE